jgi:ribosome-associated protein
LEPTALGELAARTAIDKRATDVVILDLTKLTIVCDYFVIATARNSVHAKAVVEGIEEQSREVGRRPMHIEGAAAGRWVLMDYGDVVVHVFQKEDRAYYDLERLWADAKVKQLEEVVGGLRGAHLGQTVQPQPD